MALRVIDRDAAVFWDWGSMYQLPRDVWQDDAFKRGLKQAHLWFASRLVWKVLLTKLPNLCINAWEFHDRGWTTFECAVSGLITDSDMVLDLGPLADDLHIEPDGLEELKRVCHAQRGPPLSPNAFSELISQKHFNDAAHTDLIIELYNKTFSEIISGIDRLFFSGMQWGAAEIGRLAESLRAVPQPPPLKLQELWLARNCIGDEGTLLLATILTQGYLPSLTCLLLDYNDIGPKGAQALIKAFDYVSKLETLGLSGNNLDEENSEAIKAACLRRGITLGI